MPTDPIGTEIAESSIAPAVDLSGKVAVITGGAGSIGLAHIDVVLLSAVEYAQDSAWDVMAPGGYLVYDDATEPTCPGATRAVEEMICNRHISMEQIYPHVVLRARLES